MTLSVGDIVEVLPRTRDIGPDNVRRDAWTGRILVVAGFGRADDPLLGPAVPFVRTSPGEPGRGWLHESLRKIEPPDWKAPRVREIELTT